MLCNKYKITEVNWVKETTCKLEINVFVDFAYGISYKVEWIGLIDIDNCLVTCWNAKHNEWYNTSQWWLEHLNMFFQQKLLQQIFEWSTMIMSGGIIFITRCQKTCWKKIVIYGQMEMLINKSFNAGTSYELAFIVGLFRINFKGTSYNEDVAQVYNGQFSAIWWQTRCGHVKMLAFRISSGLWIEAKTQ